MTTFQAALPQQWRRVKLAELVTTRSGNSKQIKGKLYSSPGPGRYPGYSASGQDVWLDRYEHEGDAIIVSAVGARCGKCFRASGKWSAIANTHIVRPNSDLIITDYLFYLINDENFWLRHQMGQPFVRISDTLQKEIPLPPLDEQRRIIRALDKQMAAVARARTKAEQQEADLFALLQCLLQMHFQNIRPLAINDEHDGAPIGWQWRKLSEIARLESGHTPSRRHSEWWGGDIPWIALPDIRALDGRTAFETIEKTNELGLANSAARLLPPGTVVLSRTASVGFVTVMGRPMATSQDFVNWVCGEELESWFLAYLLIACRDYLRELASGAIHKTIYVPTVEAFCICMPSKHDQQRIVSEIDAARVGLERAERAAKAQLASINALHPSLLHAAFSGAL
ncbi:MAG TPA: restriction endonuclease subunit S [Beijerinckiaceae bacterium]|jgi:type I restriction enzyme S subunit